MKCFGLSKLVELIVLVCSFMIDFHVMIRKKENIV